jgi:hypothetical protein
MQLLTCLLYTVSTYSSDDPRGEYLLLQPEHRKPVVLYLVHVLENILLPHLLVQPSVIKKVNDMMNSQDP